MALFTIGYEGLDQRQFLAYLRHHGVDVVADIRKLPMSRKKGFSKSALAVSLQEANIEYFNIRELGAPSQIRDELYASGDYDRFFRKYREALADNRDSLKSLYNFVARGKKVALLCFERDPKKCHRNVVASELQELDGNGLAVKHIIPL